MSEMDSNKQCQKKAKGRENANNGESETKEQNDPFDIEMCVLYGRMKISMHRTTRSFALSLLQNQKPR